jgi:hypothetical protein
VHQPGQLLPDVGLWQPSAQHRAHRLGAELAEPELGGQPPEPELGADVAVDYAQPRWPERVREGLGERELSVVLDYRVKNANPFTPLIETGRDFISGSPAPAATTYLIALALVAGFGWWAVRGLRRAEAAG